MDDMRQRVYSCIVDHIETEGVPPTISEIAKCVGRSGTSVRWHLTKLEEEERIKRIPGRAGGIIVV